MSIGVFAIIGAALLGLALLYGMIRNGQRTSREVDVSEAATREMRRDPEGYEAATKRRLQREADKP